MIKNFFKGLDFINVNKAHLLDRSELVMEKLGDFQRN
jgi:hypothetical protein